MKKICLVSGFLALVTHSAFAQGTVNFNNRDLNPPRLVYLSDPLSGVGLVGTNWFALLYYGAPGSTETSLVPVDSPPARFRPTTTIFPGTWQGGTRTLEGFFNYGGLDDPRDIVLQVRVWDSNVGSDYDTAHAVLGGSYTVKSVMFPYSIPFPSSSSEAYLMYNFPGIPGIPEPSTLLLAYCGLLIGFLFRRCVRRS